MCLLAGLADRGIVGHSAGPRKDAALVRAAFATLEFPISDIEVFHTDRGSEFDNATSRWRTSRKQGFAGRKGPQAPLPVF